jgi:glycerophosphoryl diester phosphodiesterase
VQVGNLKYLAKKTDLPLIQLLGGSPDAVVPDTGVLVAEMTTDAELQRIALYARGIGPGKGAIVPTDSESRTLLQPTTLVKRAHAAGLKVRPPGSGAS